MHTPSTILSLVVVSILLTSTASQSFLAVDHEAYPVTKHVKKEKARIKKDKNSTQQVLSTLIKALTHQSSISFNHQTQSTIITIAGALRTYDPTQLNAMYTQKNGLLINSGTQTITVQCVPCANFCYNNVSVKIEGNNNNTHAHNPDFYYYSFSHLQKNEPIATPVTLQKAAIKYNIQTDHLEITIPTQKKCMRTIPITIME